MPKRSVRASKRAMGFLSFLIALAALAALGLVIAIVIRDRRQIPPTDAVVDVPADDFVDADALTDSEIVLKAPSYSEPSYVKATLVPGVTPSPEPTPTPRPTLNANDPGAALRPAPRDEGLLPVFSKANREDKVIAITLDECSGVNITRQFLTLAQEYGAKLTLFPTGENVMKAGMADVMRMALFQMGYEIENRGYSTISRFYQATDGVMVQEIWKQSVAVNFVLGVRYQPHFLRVYGGVGEYDHRTHAYLKQQGYLGIAHWTYSCTGMKARKLASSLTPGAIYSFRTTSEDGELMKALMEAAREEGYRMVTLNELFGYPSNAYETVEGSLLSETMPQFSYPDNTQYDVFPGETSWDVYSLQSRLAQLGYMLPGEVDGRFGEGTTDALRMFQAQAGRAASGAGDVATLKALYSQDAPRNTAKLETPTPAPGELWEEDEDELVPSE